LSVCREQTNQNQIYRHLSYLVLGIVSLIVVLTPSKANAHPHVFIESETKLLMNNTFEITGFRHRWKFDDGYAAFALVGMDVNKDGKYSQYELEPLAKENIESLHQFDFFTYGKQKKRNLEFNQPIDTVLTYTNQELVLEFTLPLKKPQKILANPLKFGIYDPEFFIAFLEPKKNSAVAFSKGTSPQCMIEKKKAGADQTALIEQRLGQPMDLTNEENRGAGSLFAPTFTVSCLSN
jgi:ABC-type uncharacterized transport system substrate-binding protein